MEAAVRNQVARSVGSLFTSSFSSQKTSPIGTCAEPRRGGQTVMEEEGTSEREGRSRFRFYVGLVESAVY
ncbi:hypothetical protein Nepgr_005758 [Nepenthes gracilis]|uniref:Uncharacterized protein n=1 Tax=Nepenthes gracilis TaxID=150966 RepID=A0AAD3S3T3_NEPGR|nr:hypothetical protein Nepgr_005758 [Nepenthes gracilis]